MIKTGIILSICLLTFYKNVNAQLPFTPGNLAVSRVGDGISVLPSTTVPVFIDEYTPSGQLVQSIALPVVDQGANKAITLLGTYLTTPTGLLNLSVDGRYLLLSGYGTAPGMSSPSLSSTIFVPRVIGLVKYDGSINTATALTDYSSFGAPVAAVSTNGTDIWCTTNTTASETTNGIRYAGLGSTTSVKVYGQSSGAEPIAAGIRNGQLYLATNNGTPKFGPVGTGLPKTENQPYTALPGFPTTGNAFSGFVFLDMNPDIPGDDVLYVTSVRVATGGFKKYSLVGGTWVLNGTIGTGAHYYSGLAVKVTGNSVTLFTTRMGSNSSAVRGGELVSLTDPNGYNGAFSGSATVLASAVPIDTRRFLGVALVPSLPPACALSIPKFSDITPTEAVVNWTSVPSVTGYQYALSTDRIPPASGSPIAITTIKFTGLINNTKYYLHLRTECTPFNYSSWTTDSFNTGCKGPAISALKVTNIRNTGTADITWSGVIGATGYEYAITTDTNPPVSGTATVQPSFQATRLKSATTYYLHVRSECSSGNYSSWTSKAFGTGCLAPVVSTSPNTGLNWHRVNGVESYEYAITSFKALPQSGTLTQDTSHTFSQLPPGSGNYFHIRTKCAAGAKSEWTTYAFHVPGIETYPNPVRNVLTIRLSDININGQLYIYDATGKCLRAIQMVSNTTTVDMKGMATGIYLIKYADGKEKYSVKVLKQ